MQLRTTLSLTAYAQQIDYDKSGLWLGSCFAESIGARVRHYKLPVTLNPFGVQFNPESIAHTLDRLSEGRLYTESELCREGSRWVSFDHHGSFDGATPSQTLEAINRALQSGHQALRSADYVVLTFGTAWVYRLVESNRVVGNCHKFPAATFRRERLSVEQILTRYEALMESVLRGKHVILTVSPVRHLKDGLPGNALSKATLLVAAQTLAERYRNCSYFPAYEILNDDLRDYRFYNADMVHPSEVAIEYVWERFREVAVDASCERLFGLVDRIRQAMDHRPLHPESVEYQTFRQRMVAQIEAIRVRYPALDFSEELQFFTHE